MSITALVFLGVFALGMFLSFVRHPMFGLLTYLWTFYNPPPQRWWGAELPDLRWALVAAIITLISVWRYPSPIGRPPWHENWGARLLVLFTAWLWLQSTWAFDKEDHWFLSILFTKYVMVFYVIYRLLHEEQHLALFYWANVIGCFIWGWDAYRTSVHGRLESIGSADVSGANGASVQLVVGLIFAGFMFLGAKGLARWILLAIIPFILNAIILTATRGGFVAMMASGLMVSLLAPRRYRLRVFAVGLLGVVLLFRLGNDVFWDRIETLQDTTVHEDKSAESRLVIAQANWKMALDYPLGVGHRGNEILSPGYVSAEYLTPQTGTRAAHNTFLAILVDHGIPGAILFVGFALWALVSVWRVIRLDSVRLDTQLRIYAAAIGPALLSCFVAGQFSNFLEAEIQVWLAGLMVVLTNLIVERATKDSRSAIDGRIEPSLRNHDARSLPATHRVLPF
jgi:O-antigen ligase